MVHDVKEQWKQAVLTALIQIALTKGVEKEVVTSVDLLLQKPPKPEMGDIAIPLFAFAKAFKTSPQQIAVQLLETLNSTENKPDGDIQVAGPYINIKTDLTAVAKELYEEISVRKENFGKTEELAGRSIVVEFSCPNTNKPLHLGHLRNDSIGESISRILAANGARVRKVNLINDRGVHICKSMLAYQKFGNGETPESTGIKSDHFVGDYYVKFAQWAKTDPNAEPAAQAMLKAWEDGDPEVTALWKTMNDWTISGIQETYEKTGISFDALYYESKTYTRGKTEVLKGLEKGIFYKEADGSIWVDLEPAGLDKKVLLRKDGTSLYLTQDIGTAIARHADWPFDTLIYVVASEQAYHFKVLFYVLDQLGFSWAKNLYHLSYGMVNLPEGKMKSREGTVVDADELFAELSRMAEQEIRDKERESEVGDVEMTAAAIAQGALNYYLLQVNPTKDMVFNPADSISFNGNTGPYLQYMGARISSMNRKFQEVSGEYASVAFNPELLKLDDERELIKLISSYPEAVASAGKEMNPSIITAFLYELAKTFSHYYHDNKILRADSQELVKARISLAEMVLQVLRNAFDLVGIPYLSSM